jgi:RimJ/RimL family protein N-acetyltransferase
MILSSELRLLKGNTQCVARSVCPSDITKEYIDSLRSNNRLIKYSGEKIDANAQANYVERISVSRRDVLIGFFQNGELLGTCGMQKLSQDDLWAVGVLLFDKLPRAQGWGRALLWSSCALMSEAKKAKRFVASTRTDNFAAQGAFQSIGFREIIRDDTIAWIGCLASAIEDPDGVYTEGLILTDAPKYPE